jgi:hypothetical protein
MQHWIPGEACEARSFQRSFSTQKEPVMEIRVRVRAVRKQIKTGKIWICAQLKRSNNMQRVQLKGCMMSDSIIRWSTGRRTTVSRCLNEISKISL